VSALGGGRLPWDAEDGGAAAEITPATIFPGVSMLWLDGYGGAFLRDSGGNVPDNAEAVATAVDRGNVGNCTAGAGITYDSSAFGGRGAMSFPGSTAAKLSSPSWTMNGRGGGGGVWRFNADFSTLYQHGAVNAHSAVFREGSLKARRALAGATEDTTIAASTGVDRSTVFALSTDEGVLTDSAAGTATNSVDRTMGTAAAITYVGGLDIAFYPMTGYIGELVLVDATPTAGQLTALRAYFLAKWGT
jgi:hypothetical protein